MNFKFSDIIYHIRIYLLILTTVLFVSSCKKIDSMTQFDMEYDETIVIESYTGVNLPFNFYTPEIESDSESVFSVNDTRKDLIEEIVLTDLEMNLISPSNADFGFLKSIEIYLSAEGMSEVKVAWKNDIPDDAGNYLMLETTGDDLKEYIKKDEFKLRVNTVTDEIITSDHVIDINSVFFVDAKILGQ